MPLDYNILYLGQQVLFASNWMKLGDLKKARYYLEKAEQLNSGRPEVAYYWGEWHERKGNSEKALSFYEKAIKKSPETFLYHFKKGTLHLSMGNAFHSKREYEICQQLITDKKEILVNLGVLERVYGRLESSENYLKKAFQKYPDDENLSYQYAQTLFDARKYEMSLAILQKMERIRRSEKIELLLLLNFLHLNRIKEFGDELKDFLVAFGHIRKFSGVDLSEGFLSLRNSFTEAAWSVEAELACSIFLRVVPKPNLLAMQELAELQMQSFHLNAAILTLETLILRTKDPATLALYFRYLERCYTSLGIAEAVEMCRQKIVEILPNERKLLQTESVLT